jgi:ribose transport system permease protein
MVIIVSNTASSPNNKRNIDFSISSWGILLPFIILFVTLSLLSPYFFTLDNIMTVVRQAVFVGIVAFGMTFVIALGRIDLSSGAILGLCALLLAKMILGGVSIYLSIAAIILLGTGFGAINGLLVSKLNMPDFIVTLATQIIFRGSIMVISKGIPVYGLRFPAIQWFAQAALGPVPIPVIIAAVMFMVCFYVMYKTRFGRHILAVGSNEDAARLVGIKVDWIKIKVFMISGALAALSAVLVVSRLEAATPETGSNYELDAIAATVIGGTSLSGGRSNLFGTVIGAILMAMVRNGLNLLNVSTYWHQVVMGLIIVIAVATDRINVMISGKNQN